MKTFHINPQTGVPGECSAKPGNCPYGADAPHYSTKEEARAAFEKLQASALPVVPPLKSLRINGHDWKFVTFSSGVYSNGELAIQLQTNDQGYAEPLTTATVNLEEYGYHPAEGAIFIKTWGGNEGLFESLEQAGVIEGTGRQLSVGAHGATVFEARLLPPYDRLAHH